VLIRASISVASEHNGLVRFAGGSGARDGWLEVDLVDFSSSGVGIMSPVFVPRRAAINVRLYGYGPEAPVILEAPLSVQRVCMTDRRPAYLIGTSFGNCSPKSIDQINKLMELLAGSEEAPSGPSR
jgi:hypothetical protein